MAILAEKWSKKDILLTYPNYRDIDIKNLKKWFYSIMMFGIVFLDPKDLNLDTKIA